MSIHRIYLLMLVVFLLTAPCGMRADEGQWYLKTNTGKQIALADVSFLLMADGTKTFSVANKLNVAINDVRCVTFEKVVGTGIVSAASDSSVCMYPNPVMSSLTLSGLHSGTGILILSASGAVVKSVKSASQSVSIDVSSLSAGMYLIHAAGATFKFIKR